MGPLDGQQTRPKIARNISGQRASAIFALPALAINGVTALEYRRFAGLIRSPEHSTQGITKMALHPLNQHGSGADDRGTPLASRQRGNAPSHLTGGLEESMRLRVRQATRGDHRLDEAISAFDLTDQVSYGRFLRIHYVVLSGFAHSGDIRDCDFPGLLVSLIQDFKMLGYKEASYQETERHNPRKLSGRQLGIAYVIRGSQLGAKVLRRRVPVEYPCAYLGYIPSVTWPSFLLQFESSANEMPSSERTRIVHGARSAFGAFFAAAEGA